MPKYVVYYMLFREKQYLTTICNKRPYSSKTRTLAREFDSREQAEEAREQAYRYSGHKWMVEVAEDGKAD